MHDIPSAQLRAAASYLSSATAQVSTATKLELYGLFKYITVSPTPSASRPSIFDMTSRAKWDAWNSASKKYSALQAAEERYIEIAKTLGWTEGMIVKQPPEHEPPQPEIIWDDDNQYHKVDGYSGMGGSVSTMAHLEEVIHETMHGLAVSGNATSLRLLLDKNPEADVNMLDEFGYTPLHLSCDRGNLETVQFLLSRGADPGVKDPDGLTASELAEIAGHGSIQECLRTATDGTE